MPVIQERKEVGARGERKSGKKEADNSISILLIPPGIFKASSIPIIQR